MYFIGILIVILGGIALKKLNYFSGDPAPFVMELPAYHFPSLKGVFIHVWERVKAFMIKAGTIIFIVCVILWFLMNFNFGLQMVALEESMLKSIGDCIAWIFSPLGFGTWQGAVASVSAELAKEQATATLAMLAATGQEMEETKAMLTIFNNNSIAALSFMIFNLFNAPCLVAIVTAFREQGDLKWGWFTFIFQMLVGYCLALCVYQYGMVAFGGASFGFWTVVAVLITIFAAIMVLRPSKAR
jgi:ferrous iron transport protein B